MKTTNNPLNIDWEKTQMPEDQQAQYNGDPSILAHTANGDTQWPINDQGVNKEINRKYSEAPVNNPVALVNDFNVIENVEVRNEYPDNNEKIIGVGIIQE